MSIEHQVQAGDCITSIAYENGFFWTTLWEHPDNAELKEKRGSPFQLLPGDVVKVPDLRVGEVEKPTEKKHTFKLKGVPAALIVTVMRIPADVEDEADDNADELEDDPDSATFEDPPETTLAEEPAANVEYVLQVGSRSVRGKTNGEGRVKILIMPDDREGKLIIEPGTPRERSIDLALGGLDPINTMSGVAQRLNNLGFGPVPHGLDVTELELSTGIAAFQRAFGLELNGKPDEATLERIQDVHGS